ncbi:MAG: hypothetical protein JNK15_04025 [Planctomycetes bacterium]|nr:hypothetical protein [Planctomycetota bacterium]
MEDDVFLRPAVAGTMKKDFVEARLHVDLQKHLTKEQFARNKELQKQFTKSRAMPTFVVVDPQTGKKLGEAQPEGLTPGTQTENWGKFLGRMIEAAGRKP